jgi:hypothetical protein
MSGGDQAMMMLLFLGCLAFAVGCALALVGAYTDRDRLEVAGAILVATPVFLMFLGLLVFLGLLAFGVVPV